MDTQEQQLLLECAMLIKKIKASSCSFRKLDEVWHLNQIQAGNQIDGQELCKEAASILGESVNDWDATQLIE